MKIGPNSTLQHRSSLKVHFFQTIGRYGLLILGIIGLLTGFLYAWRLAPDSHSRIPVQTSTVEGTPTATPEPISLVIVKPLPVLSMTIPTLDGGKPDLTTSLPATLVIDGGSPLSVVARPATILDGTIFAWHLTLSQPINDFPLSGTQFDLVYAVNGEAISKWTYLSQLQQIGMQVPNMTVCLVSLNDAENQAYYLIQMSPLKDSTSGFYLQLPEEFFTREATDSLLQQVEETLTQQQPELDPAIKQRGLDLLALLEQHPDEAAQYLDISLFARYFAIHDLWGISYGELTYFYNAETGKLEPAISSPEQVTLSGKREEITLPFANLALFEFPELQIAYIQALSELTTQEAYQNFKLTVFDVFHAHEKQIRLANETPYSTTWDVLDFRNTMLRLQVQPAYPVRGFVHAESDSSCIAFNILNLMVSPVDVTAINFYGENIPIKPTWVTDPDSSVLLEKPPNGLRLKAYQNQDTFLNLCVPSEIFIEILEKNELKDSLEEALTDDVIWNLETKVSGLNRTYLVSMIPDAPAALITQRPIPEAMSIEYLESTFPFIRATTDNKTLTFLSGAWAVERDLVIPAGWQIVVQAGTKLSFAPQAVFLSYSPLLVKGTESQPVSFSSIGTAWPGLVVLNAGQPSILEHLLVENTSGIARDGWILTGGITFYRSPVTVRDSIIRHAFTEDAINVISTDFKFERLTIQDTPSDAFDADFTQGEITNCLFQDIGGDAVDISGSTVHVADSIMLRILDKGLSVGEDSQLIAKRLTISEVSIGAAAKDLSSLLIKDSIIQNATVAGLAAYIKKPVYGPSEVTAENVQILDTPTLTLNQTGSTITLNGKKQASRELDVKTLYALGILGN